MRNEQENGVVLITCLMTTYIYMLTHSVQHFI